MSLLRFYACANDFIIKYYCVFENDCLLYRSGRNAEQRHTTPPIFCSTFLFSNLAFSFSFLFFSFPLIISFLFFTTSTLSISTIRRKTATIGASRKDCVTWELGMGNHLDRKC